MEPQDAIKLLMEHDIATVAVVNSTLRGQQKATREHTKSARNMLRALLGRDPTDAELAQATSW